MTHSIKQLMMRLSLEKNIQSMLSAVFKTALAATLATPMLFGCSLLAEPQREPHYPLLRDSIYSDEEIPVIESDNVLKTAIKENRFAPVIENEAINNNAAKVFAEVLQSRSLAIQDLQGEEFHRGLEMLIKQFTCELYASKQPKDSVQLCPLSNTIVDNNLNYLPFEYGRRTSERLTVTTTNASQTLELEFFLKSSNERSLESLWGAVHELGTFNGSTLDEANLVLTVNLQAYKKPADNQQWHSLHSEPLIFFVVLPSVEHLTARPNEVESMRFAYRSAKLLLVDSR
ncbi:hypothetical protein VISI1226_00100 [Vibrio sinaloensis DSM 21326]|uniref:Uncharacterized protein n=1 Tax=Vibrio sinaloensis DSM 21326 TaxID=945550 RepID=E8M5W9_PHOS4|nr:hypothetical protein [Vibrio sinaloensis]EGA70419.1 hypothetical protein VISI1226_00100 [Vibrio sinaloensis DSM 21326]